MGSSFDVDVDGNNIVGAIFLGLLVAPNICLVDVQKACYRNEQLEQLFNSMWTFLTWWAIGPSHRCVVHIEIDSWMLLHFMICHKLIAWNLMHTQLLGMALEEEIAIC
jgi:hypothetical protein